MSRSILLIVALGFSLLFLNSNSIYALEGQLKFTVRGNSQVREVSGFLTEKRCNELLVSAREQGFERPNFDPKHRDCKRLHTVDPKLSSEIMAQIRQYLPEIVIVDGVRWRLNRFTHHWRFIKYEAGGHFSPHYDGAKMLPWHEMTMFTVQIYLNKDFTKGTTRFYMDYKPDRKPSHDIGYGQVVEFKPQGVPTDIVIPSTGKVLIFNHAENTLHDGEPVGEGLKFILRGDVLYSAMKEDIPKLQEVSSNPANKMWSEECAKRGATKDYAGHVWKCKCGDDSCGHDLEEFVPPTKRWRIAALDGESTNSKMQMVLVNGKRASGKDFVTDRLQGALENWGLRVHRASLGSINKRLYALKNGLDLNKLETDRVFKELHRIALIEHHKEMDRINPEWAIAQVVKEAREANAEVLLISDLRTDADLKWFQSKASTQLTLLRIDAQDEARLSRGWDPDTDKDLLFTEVELDNFSGWTARFDNSDNSPSGEKLVDEWIKWTVLPRMGMVPPPVTRSTEVVRR